MGRVPIIAAKRGHHDRAKADDAGIENGSGGRFSVVSLRVESEVDHHDGVLFDDADEHEQADEAVDIQFLSEQRQRQQRAKAGGRQTGKNRERMDEAFVENAEDDVDDEHGHEQKQAEISQTKTERLGPFPETAC